MVRTLTRSMMWAIVMLCVATSAHATSFEVTKVANTVTSFATFQSHNQKIVQNAYGIFMTYSYRESSGPLGTWRLARSIDGGKSWGTLYRSFIPTKPPTLETDEHGSIFVISSDFTDSSTAGNATFYRFDPDNAFRAPTITKTIVNGSAGKYTSYYDRGRKRLYYATFWDGEAAGCIKPTFFALDRDGNVVFNQCLTLPGVVSRLQYPHLEMSGATLYFAWTTTDYNNPSTYQAILYVLSEDGGSTWRTAPSSGSLALPFLGDHNGPGNDVTLGDEIGVNAWLANFIFKGGYLHFAYQATNLNRQHYMRFSPATGLRDVDRQPTWQADSYTLKTPSGFFSSELAATTPLFVSGHTEIAPGGTHVAILKSSDLGVTWQDHAISSAPTTNLYALGGNRELTKTGHILGHFTREFTQNAGQPGKPQQSVWFYRAPAVDRSTDPYKDWMFFPVNVTNAQPDSGFAYTVPLSVRHGGDSLQSGSYSKLRLFEDGVEIGPAHTQHATIRTTGGGRFSHWGGSLYFSASNNTDPRNNNRKYEVAIPWTEVSGPVLYGRINPAMIAAEQGHAFTVTQDFGTPTDSSSAPSASKLRLYEDGALLGPPHEMHATIRSAGQGRYSHWSSGSLFFSSSDNTDPRTNGRNYTWAIEGSNVIPCATLHVEDAVPELGNAYTLERDFGLATDSSSNPTASSVRLFENGLELGPAHSGHQDIRTEGGGRFSDWNGGWIYFSSSDNSDPRTNGRIYTWGSTGTCPQ